MDRELYNAATSGDVSFLKTKEDAEIRDLLLQITATGSSVLHLAAEFRQLEFFKEAARLCSPPSVVKQANSKGDTPLHSAVRGARGSTEVVKFIIEHAKELFSDIEQGHDVEGYKEVLRMENLDGDNALHLAARHYIENYHLARLLIEADPQLSIILNSKSQQSACFIALAKRNNEVADVLLSCSNPSCSLLGQINGMTALHVATIGRLHVVDKLMEAAPDMIKQCDDKGWTPLHYAASLGIIWFSESFLKKDRSVAYKLEMQDGLSALHIAASMGYVSTMKKIIEACPDCGDLVDKRGRNALHAAVLGSRKDAVSFLLSLPGDTLSSEADQDGNTPLQLAILRKDDGIVRAFLTLAALVNSILHGELRHAKYSRNDIHKEQQKALQRVQNALTKDITNKNDASSSKDDQEYYQFSATLIATVTFTAAFTLPGGFIQSGSTDEGMAVLISKPTFQAFIIFDVLAFFASLSIVILLLFYKGADITIRKALFIYLSISYYGMALAFCCGLYVVLSNTSGFAIVVLVMSVIGTLVAIFGSVTIGLRKLFYAIARAQLFKILFRFFLYLRYYLCCFLLELSGGS